MKHAAFFRGAAIVTFSFLLAKALGAFYRIPLAGLLGSYGTGLYQMAYPLFLFFLTFSSSGVSSAIARAVAGEEALGRETGSLVKTALRLFGLAGLTGALLMCAVAPFMSAVQGDESLVFCYFSLAPAILFVSLISVFRGYFQGRGNMAPTACSEIAEQLVKLAAGLLLVRFAASPAGAAALALFAVTLSEGVALLLLIMRYRGERRIKSVRKISASSLISSVLPVMASAALLPLSRTLDSVFIVRLMSRYTRRAVSLYGLFTGGALALVDLPASLASGFAAVSTPAVTSAFARGREEEGREAAARSLLVTFLFALPAAVVLFFFAQTAVKILFPTLSVADAKTLVSLIRLSSVSAATLAGVNVLSACLTGMGRAKYAARAMFFAVTVKFLLQAVLVSDPAFGILGAAAASNCCYLVAFFLDWVYTFKKHPGRKSHDNSNRIGHRKGRNESFRTACNEARRQGASQKRRHMGRDAGSGGDLL